MTLIKLPTALRVMGWIAKLHQRCYNRLLRRLFSNWLLAVWEVPDADRLLAASFMELLDRMYDKNAHERGALQQMIVFRKKTEPPQLVICGAFSRDYWEGVQPFLSKVVGVERTFMIDPTILVAQSLTGAVDMQVCYNR